MVLQEFCLDLFEPSGHGRRRRAAEGYYNSTRGETTTVRMQRSLTGPEGSNETGVVDPHFTKFGENIAYTVLMKENGKSKVTINIKTLYSGKKTW